MSDRIIICGLNGAGKSTFGRALAEVLDYPFADIEDYYFSADDISYSNPRSKSEVSKLLLSDIISNENFILSAIKGDYGENVSQAFSIAVYLDVPKAERLKRVKDRSAKRFGERIKEGGDLFEKENDFFRIVESRSEELVTKWLIKYDIPVIVLDGTRAVHESVAEFIKLRAENTFSSSLKSAVTRIQLMENFFDSLQRELLSGAGSFKSELWIKDMLLSLSDYHADGRWLYDYSLDEAGLLPKALKRGVLSEDGLYDFLTDINNFSR